MDFRPLMRLGLALLLLGQGRALGEDFAIRTEVIDPRDQTTLAENLTVFQAGKIYDFMMSEPRAVTEFDTDARRFVLADRALGIRTALSADELVRFAATEHAKAMESSSPLIRFAANPRFEETYDAKAGTISLTSPHWDYEVTGSKWDDPEKLRRYGEFANWYTYLNAMFSPFPPGLRLELNRTLDRRAWWPQHVLVRIKRDNRVVTTRASRHHLISPLTEVERELVQAWQAEQAKLEFADFVAYRKDHLDGSRSRKPNR